MTEGGPEEESYEEDEEVVEEGEEGKYRIVGGKLNAAYVREIDWAYIYARRERDRGCVCRLANSILAQVA